MKWPSLREKKEKGQFYEDNYWLRLPEKVWETDEDIRVLDVGEKTKAKSTDALKSVTLTN